ncbi:MAG: M14 family zinc carboxypeptidase [Longimicrobiales bacterium]|nr:M14 family zinc carboxypeptidase [Longimicrobiales bacterium]
MLLAPLAAPPAPAVAQTRVTAPMQQLGHNIGDDYFLATYTQLMEYWQKLAMESPRMLLDTIGVTAEGRPQLMAIVSSPENLRNLDKIKADAKRLALAKDLTDDEARKLSREAKAVVWIDGGLHATEVLGAAQLMEMLYQLVSMDDEETLRLLNDEVILLVHANPDGMELVSSWYMREPDPLKRSTGGVPRLYQKYIGHDNNRDSYMVTQPETENMGRVMYSEWYPQMMYNHHQTGPTGAVLFAPPFRDPHNYWYHPLLSLGVATVGTAMHSRLVAEGKPGSTMRKGANYSTWFNGGLRTTSYFHNIIGILTESSGNPTPMEIAFVPDKTISTGDLPAPIEPQEWHFRQAVDYSITMDRAYLDYASRYKDVLLYNRYQMGRDAIRRGQTDSWTIHPKMVAEVQAQIAAQQGAGANPAAAPTGRSRGLPKEGFQAFRKPEDRDPRGYILPSNQPDFPTAVKFVNTLVKNGVEIQRATRDFQVQGKSYPAGSLVVKTAQAYAPHVFDMFEPQDHPNDFEYPGGPPIPPYDNAGYTLALQMGVQFDRILEGFDGPFEAVDGLVTVPAGRVADANGAAGYLLSHQVNDGVIATNRLLAAKQEVYWLSNEVTAAGKSWPAGTLYIPATAANRAMVDRMAAELGLSFQGVSSTPVANALKLSPVRVGLWDQYGGSMPSGWARWMFEQYEVPFDVVYAPELDRGGLNQKYDVLVFEDGGIPEAGGGNSMARGSGRGPDPSTIPAEYRDQLGSVTPQTTVPNLLGFVRDGGTLLAIGGSTSIATHAGLPVSDHMVDAQGKPLTSSQYYVPSSLLRVRVDNTQPVAYGMPDHVPVMFDNSPVFDLGPSAAAAGITRVGWFDSPEPLVSGWAWGQEHLDGGTAIMDVKLGEGRMFLFGPLIKERAQPHGTFKLLFNGVQLGGATPVTLGGKTVS